MSDNYFPSSGTPYAKYYNVSTKEIDLRAELNEIFYGSDSMEPHSFLALYRRLGTTRCTCWDDIRHESDPRCPYCKGEAYLWEEEPLRTYKVVAAPIYGKSLSTLDLDIQKLHVLSMVFYAEYNANPKTGDAIIEVALDREGKIKSPVSRTRLWRIRLPEIMRSDRGRIEFFRIHCTMEPLS